MDPLILRTICLSMFFMLMAANYATAQDNARDSLPKSAIRRLGTAAFRQGSAVVAMAVYPDGKRVATVSDKGIHLWHAENGKEIAFAELPPPPKRIVNEPVKSKTPGVPPVLSVSRDGSKVYFFRNGSMHVYPSSLMGPPVLFCDSSPLLRIQTAQFGGDGRLFGLSDKGSLMRWNQADARWDALPIGKNSEKASFLQATIRWAIFAGRKGVIRTWDVEKAGEIEPIKVSAILQGLKVSPDGVWLAAAYASEGAETIVDVWDLSQRKLASHIALGAYSKEIAISTKGELLASINDRREEVVIWDAKNGKQRFVLKLEGMQPSLLQFSPDGERLFMAGKSGVTRVFNARTGIASREDDSALSGVRMVRFLKDETLLVCHEDGKIREWTTQGEKAKSWTGSTIRWPAFALSVSEKTAIHSGRDSILRVRDLPGKKEKVLRAHDKSASNGILALAISADEKRIACSEFEGLIRFIEPASGKQTRLIRAGKHTAGKIAFLPNGKLLSRDSTRLALWNSEDGQMLSSLDAEGTQFGKEGFTVSDDGKLVALCVNHRFGPGKQQSDLMVWNTETGLIAERFNLNVPRLTSIASDRDWKWFLLGTATGDVLLWNVAQQKLHATYTGGHRGAVECLAVAPDGRTFASGGADTTVMLWKMPAP